MKEQHEYSDADRLYGAWVGVKDRIHRIDYGVANEEYPGQRDDLRLEVNELAGKYQKLTGQLPS